MSRNRTLPNKQLGLFCHLSGIVATLSRRIPWERLTYGDTERAKQAIRNLTWALRHAEGLAAESSDEVPKEGAA
jgi:hypothetical protein